MSDGWMASGEKNIPFPSRHSLDSFLHHLIIGMRCDRDTLIQGSAVKGALGFTRK